MIRKWQIRENERGAATTALLVIGIFAAVAVLFIAVLPLSSGTEKSDRAQTAADAAALAGAEKMRDEIIENLAQANPPFSLVDLIDPQTGRSDAQKLASNNKADLLNYHATPLAGEVRVTVEQLETMPKTEGHAKARATANFDLSLNSCKFGEEDVEDEDEDDRDDDAEEGDDEDDGPPPEPDKEYSFTCPGLPNFEDYDELDDLINDVKQALNQRLKPKLAQ